MSREQGGARGNETTTTRTRATGNGKWDITFKRITKGKAI